MSLPTFKQFLAESLSDLAKGKGQPARATYPKTNFKRFMDDWNEKLGKWVANGMRKEYTIVKRVNAGDGPMIIDMIDQDKLVSTAVISGHDDMKSGNFTFDFYNQENVHSPNKYRVNPNETSYEKDWVWKMIEGDTLHHSDQRNVFTSDKVGRTMANSRVKDGDAPSWATALRGKSKKSS